MNVRVDASLSVIVSDAVVAVAYEISVQELRDASQIILDASGDSPPILLLNSCLPNVRSDSAGMVSAQSTS